MGLLHSLPLQLGADQSPVSPPGGGPKSMVLVSAPILVLVWNWALTQGHQTPLGGLLLDTWSLVSQLFSLGEFCFRFSSLHSQVFAPSESSSFKLVSVRFGPSCL